MDDCDFFAFRKAGWQPTRRKRQHAPALPGAPRLLYTGILVRSGSFFFAGTGLDFFLICLVLVNPPAQYVKNKGFLVVLLGCRGRASAAQQL